MDYVWGVVGNVMDPEPRLVVLPRETAEELAEIVRLFEGCGTWGELRAEAPAELYERILGLAGYRGFAEASAHLLIGREIPGALASAMAEWEPAGDPPGDDEPFAPYDQIGAAADGDYPPDPRYVMNLQVPGDLIEAHGERYETVFNGTYARFPASAAPAVVAALEERGHTCVEDRALAKAVWRS